MCAQERLQLDVLMSVNGLRISRGSKAPQAHLDRKAVRKQAQEPAERDRGQLDALLLQMCRQFGQSPVDEILQDLLIRPRDEKVRSIVIRRQNVLRAKRQGQSERVEDFAAVTQDVPQ